MLNPEFATNGFIPDPNKSYKCSCVSNSTNFNYLQCMVMGNRIDEFIEFIKTDEAKKQAIETNSENWTALMLAVRNNVDTKFVDILLPISNINQMNNIDFDLIMLAICGMIDFDTTYAFKLLYQNSNLLYQNKHGYSAIMIYLFNSKNIDLEILNMLIIKSDLKQQSTNGNTAIMYAYNHNIEIIKLLIPKSDLMCKNNKGDTALMIFSENNVSYDILELLFNTCPEAYIPSQINKISSIIFDSYLKLKSRMAERETIKEIYNETKSGILPNILKFI